MRQALIQSYVQQLRASFGPLRPLVSEEELRALYDAGEFGRMMYRVKESLHLDCRVRLGLVNSGGCNPQAPAWVVRPDVMPIFGSEAFRQTEVTVFIRKPFLAKATFDATVIAMAHELCHPLIDAMHHPLWDKEEAVDLLAMLLGYRDFFVTGCRTVRKVNPRFHGGTTYYLHEVGYLSFEEVSYAATYMTYR